MKVEDISAKSGDERSQIGEKDIEVQQSIETSPDVDTYSQDKEISNTSPGAEIILKNRESKKKFRGSPQEKKTGSDTKLKNHRQGNQQAKNSGEKAPNKGDPGNGEPIHRHGTRQQTGHLKHGNRENDRLLNDVTKDMAHLQVQSSENTRGAFLKRNKETLTIEGSPLVKVKRRDMRPTPVAFREVGGSRSNNTATVESNSERNSSRRIVQVLSFQSQDHDTKDHQENVRRTVLLTGPKGCLRRPEINQFIQWIDESHVPPIQLSDLLRVHEYAYVNHLMMKCKQLEDPSSVSLPSFYAPAGFLDTDTPLTKSSFETAKSYCSAAIYAVDRILATSIDQTDRQLPGFSSTVVMQTPVKSSPHLVDDDHYLSFSSSHQTPPVDGQESKFPRSTSPVSTHQNGRQQAIFVIGRPPGHHAGPNGCVPSDRYWLRADMASSGFCLLNTVAVAAAYARYNYSILQDTGGQATFQRGHTADSRPIKIAIIDIDVHHGNGTEEIVRNLVPHQTYLPLPSSWAPVSQLSYKPWLNETDAEDVFFSSIHLFAEERFYPCSGGEEQSSPNILNIPLTPIGPGPWDVKGRKKTTTKQRQIYCEQASKEMRSLVLRKLLPALRTFQADVVFLSTGLDSHYDDMYHYLTEDDLHWLTTEILATTLPHTQILSILEGGYSLDPTHSTQSPSSTNEAAASDITHDTSGAPPSKASTPSHKYSIKPTDGGLVKGTLAHITALSGR